MVQVVTAENTPVLYWSNACGELHYHGEYDITEGELPRILREAYKKYWSENYRLPCYLGEVNEKFCLLFILEADEDYVHTLYRCDIDQSAVLLQQLAERLKNYSAFSCAEFILELGTGFDGCHELIISIPASIDQKSFDCFVKALEEHF